ncbi:MAG: tripartite tricarboxylate transporter substrate binding protein [Desulfobulbaceae bacterium]|nr:tripartite tricarboxylate transporter substrate binding protein [Desulfobulbaceae bacterium]
MKNKTMFKTIAAVFLIFLMMCGMASGQYPDKSLTFIVPFGAGGTTDINCRIFASMLEKELGTTIVVKNVGGAGGTIGAAEVATAKSDGYTFGFLPVGPATMQPHIKKVPYDIESWEFVANVNQVPAVLMVRKDASWNTFNDMIEDVKSNPNKYFYATTGTGNITHLTMIELLEKFGLKVQRIPHRSAAEIMKEIAADRVQIYADTPSALGTFDVKGLVVFAPERFPLLKDIPTTKEFGHEISYTVWQGVFAPKGVDPDKISIIEKAIQKVVSSQEYIDAARKVSTEPDFMSSSDFENFARAEYSKYEKALAVIKNQ